MKNNLQRFNASRMSHAVGNHGDAIEVFIRVFRGEKMKAILQDYKPHRRNWGDYNAKRGREIMKMINYYNQHQL
jgi:hypothetical protein